MKNILFIILVFWASYSLAQQNTASGGGSFTNEETGLTIDCTFGEIFNVYVINSEYTLALGTQHPAEGIYNPEGDIEISFLAMYPNPTTDFLNLEILVKNENIRNCIWKILDTSGKTVRTGQVLETRISIHVGDLASNTYLIAILNNGSIKADTFIKI